MPWNRLPKSPRVPDAAATRPLNGVLTDGRVRTWIWVLLAAGLVLRLHIAVTEPLTGDLKQFQRTADVILQLGFDAYSTLNAFDPAAPFNYRSYSYPPGFIPWLLFADTFDGRGFATVARIPPILADLALAWVAQAHLQRIGAPPRVRIAAVALVVAGPVFIAVSAASGQIDGVAFVPVVLAVLLWDRSPGEGRALAAGLLLGIGGLVKTVPLLFVFALLPTARTARERVLLLAGAVLPMILALAPFLASDARGVVDSLAYAGFPGGGGLGVLVQPELARHYLTDYMFTLSAPGQALQDVGIVITLAAFAGVSLLVFRCRTPAPQASLLIGLTLLVFAVNFYAQYLLWALPLALVCGRIRLVFFVQVVMLPYLYIEGSLPTDWLGLDRFPVPGGVGVFTVSVFVLVAVLAVGWASEVRRVVRCGWRAE